MMTMLTTLIRFHQIRESERKDEKELETFSRMSFPREEDIIFSSFSSSIASSVRAPFSDDGSEKTKSQNIFHT